MGGRDDLTASWPTNEATKSGARDPAATAAARVIICELSTGRSGTNWRRRRDCVRRTRPETWSYNNKERGRNTISRPARRRTIGRRQPPSGKTKAVATTTTQRRIARDIIYMAEHRKLCIDLSLLGTRPIQIARSARLRRRQARPEWRTVFQQAGYRRPGRMRSSGAAGAKAAINRRPAPCQANQARIGPKCETPAHSCVCVACYVSRPLRSVAPAGRAGQLDGRTAWRRLRRRRPAGSDEEQEEREKWLKLSLFRVATIWPRSRFSEKLAAGSEI
jgi:hypothetical protein